MKATQSIETLKSLDGEGRTVKSGSGFTNRSSIGYLIGSSSRCSFSTNMGITMKRYEDHLVRNNKGVLDIKKWKTTTSSGQP
ncbi:hypothetical protein O6P43_030275 [Quillaja saponaria]|uniref:Uncharacterized protein n=1 Tax=Quillaja saponaria TaxID=32244 RepID=A0AAD7KSX1_QUISA|nr:hypothetical protein O6P43_030275 [Quillaja saponaria]